jgi:hypothetical protein
VPATENACELPVALLCSTSRAPVLVPTTLACTPPAWVLIAAAMPFSVRLPEPTATLSVLPPVSVKLSVPAPPESFAAAEPTTAE